MNGGIRQSMAWLHTWTGLVCGWVLFFMFLTGSLGYFDTEIDYWMRPEMRAHSPTLDAAHAIAIAERRIAAAAPTVDRFIVYPPSGRDVPEINVFWRSETGADGRATSRSEVLDAATGLPFEARATGGGTALYQMHYLLHYLPTGAAYWLVGICTMFMLVAIVSGVITHKRIFRDFFTFRAHRGQRSWLDAHNALGVLALPFHMMITYSGLIFFCFTYMPLLVAANYGSGSANRQSFFDEAFGNLSLARTGERAALAPLESMAALAERHWGIGQIRSIDVRNSGDANARVTITRAHVSPTSNGDRLVFAGATGELLLGERTARSGPMLVNDTMMSLHEGLFAGTALRWLYFFSGLVGTAMVATGLVLWTAKRRKQASHFGLALVERLNAGTLTGVPAGIAAYFWANRLLPVDMANRADWELDVLFLVWLGLLVYAALRPRHAWRDGFACAGLLLAAVPILNAATTQRHLAVSLPAGDWVFVGFDLCAFAFGVGLLAIARRLSVRAPAASELAAHGAAASSQRPEAA